MQMNLDQQTHLASQPCLITVAIVLTVMYISYIYYMGMCIINDFLDLQVN